MEKFRNPFPTVDIIIEIIESGDSKGIVLIFRKNEPRAWAIPGGFVDYGENVEHTAVREAKEETGLDIVNLQQFHVYSDSKRDPRKHTLSVVFTANAEGTPYPADDAEKAEIFTKDNLPDDIAFDHKKILQDYFTKDKEL
ncbi:NUDIX domain-containing protein [candidate division KSB1 bacterium]